MWLHIVVFASFAPVRTLINFNVLKSLRYIKFAVYFFQSNQFNLKQNVLSTSDFRNKNNQGSDSFKKIKNASSWNIKFTSSLSNIIWITWIYTWTTVQKYTWIHCKLNVFDELYFSCNHRNSLLNQR